MMKLALISDIPDNLIALDAVLDQLKSEAPDKIVCLGDTAIFGPQPKQVLDRLYELRCPMIMGNTDAWAEYALLTWDGPEVNIDLRRVPFDVEALRTAVHASGMPHGEWGLKDWASVSETQTGITL